MCSENADKIYNNCNCVFCKQKLQENKFAKQLTAFLIDNDKFDIGEYIITQITNGTIQQKYLIEFFNDSMRQGLCDEAAFVLHFLQKQHKLELSKCIKNSKYSEVTDKLAVRRSFLQYIQSALPTASDEEILEIRKILD